MLLSTSANPHSIRVGKTRSLSIRRAIPFVIVASLMAALALAAPRGLTAKDDASEPAATEPFEATTESSFRAPPRAGQAGRRQPSSGPLFGPTTGTASSHRSTTSTDRFLAPLPTARAAARTR